MLPARNSFPLCISLVQKAFQDSCNRHLSSTRSSWTLPRSASTSEAATQSQLLHFRLGLPISRTRGHGSQISWVIPVGSQYEAVREAFPWILLNWPLGHRTSFFKADFSNSWWSRGPIEIWTIKNTSTEPHPWVVPTYSSASSHSPGDHEMIEYQHHWSCFFWMFSPFPRLWQRADGRRNHRPLNETWQTAGWLSRSRLRDRTCQFRNFITDSQF